jgi:uncharacterized protein YndB with AHSA1/START domain
MSDVELLPKTQAIVVDEVFPHRAETLWRTLTDGALMGRWMMAPSGFSAVEGTRFTFQTTPAGPWDGVIRCQVLEVVPLERLSYSWAGGHESNAGYGSRLDTIVTWFLEPQEEGTRLRLVHAGFVLPTNETAFRNMSEGWHKVLPRLRPLADEQE